VAIASSELCGVAESERARITTCLPSRDLAHSSNSSTVRAGHPDPLRSSLVSHFWLATRTSPRHEKRISQSPSAPLHADHDRRNHGPPGRSAENERESGVRVLLVYCADYRCSHSIAIGGDHWPDDLRLSE
jgi:hypothetical protein